jgi:imidazolonepropionase-like amidohydrolase
VRNLLFAGACVSCSIMAVAGVLAPVGAQQQTVLAIQGGTLIDGNGGAPVPNSVVVIQGNRIGAVGRAGQVQIPAGATLINAAGKWVLPGLIDAKSNWNWPYGEGYLRYGVTSAMVTGTRNDTGIADRDAVEHGVYPAPRLYQGVINLQGGGADGKKPDNYKPGNGARIVKDPQDAREKVRLNIEGGADFIGVADGDGQPEVFDAIVDEAHKAGKAAILRCVGPITRGKRCIETGTDVMIHTGEIGVDMNKDYAKYKDYVALPPDAYCEMDPAKEAEMVKFIAAHNTALEPDMMATDRGFPSMWERVVKEDTEFFSDPTLRTYYPEYMIRHTMENVTPAKERLTPEQYEHRMCGYKNHVKFLHDVVEAGGHVVAASDIYQSPPGLGLHQEMTVYQDDVKMPRMKIIQAATKWVADHFHMKDIGTVEQGKLADVLIVNADPLADIMNLRKIDTVIKDGKVVDRAYHPWYKGWLFANGRDDEGGPVVESAGWVAALKAATWRPNAGPTLLNIQGPAAPYPAVPEMWASPTPAIEAMEPHTIIQGSPTQTLQIKGFNYVKGSVVYFDGEPVPTEVVNRTEIRATVDSAALAQAGNRVVVVKNPLPLDANASAWGDTSNKAHILVPFSFTTAWSHNKY